jgi:hypothetical protein
VLGMPFTVESPLAILGLFTLLIPLVIHLLSKARPRVIAFAHIAFIKVKTTPKLRQLRLTQLILLMLRMCMLLLATLILAQVFYNTQNQTSHSHILVTEDWLNHATESEKRSVIDQVNGANLVLISTKNRNIKVTELAQWQTTHKPTNMLNLWSNVSDYSTALPIDSVISVYSTNRLKQFIGESVPLSKQITWHVKKVAIESIPLEYSANIKVIYDDSSTALLVYLRAAFEAINTHEKLGLIANYINYEESKKDSERLLTNNKIINISQQPFDQLVNPLDAQLQFTYISKAQLNNVQHADFVLTLARLLFSSQEQDWWLENTRLSVEQITQSSSIQDSHTQNRASLNKMVHLTSMHIWLVLLLVIIFILERLLSDWPTSRIKIELDE